MKHAAAHFRPTRGPHDEKRGNGDRTTQGLLDPQTRLHQAQRLSVGQILMHCATSVPTEGSRNRETDQRIPRKNPKVALQPHRGGTNRAPVSTRG